ncbi:MAG TPA: type II toxin-antitoxin system RelE/ParE family toxin [Phycisphaerae bacterium]|nr:type II toxin-antitoxin system RelE/ParE family toxin [Phycisphaerae bacterium]
MAFRVDFTDAARREFLDLPMAVRVRIARLVQLLAVDPRRPGTRQLAGHPGLRRAHAGRNYVVVYAIRQEAVLILIVRVGHRRDVYRGLPKLRDG